jgi:hypothetical protein
MDAKVQAPEAQPDAGLARRGLLLLALMAALAVIVVLIIVQRPSAPTGAAARDFVLPLAATTSAYPGGLPWPQLAALAEQLPSPPGWEVRYNAAHSLARRGSKNTPWATIREMLDQDQQRRNFPAKLSGGQIIADEESALRTVFTTLGVIAEWHKKQVPAAGSSLPHDLQLVYAQVDRLAESDVTQIRVQADRTRQTFFRK